MSFLSDNNGMVSSIITPDIESIIAETIIDLCYHGTCTLDFQHFRLLQEALDMLNLQFDLVQEVDNQDRVVILKQRGVTDYSDGVRVLTELNIFGQYLNGSRASYEPNHVNIQTDPEPPEKKRFSNEEIQVATVLRYGGLAIYNYLRGTEYKTEF